MDPQNMYSPQDADFVSPQDQNFAAAPQDMAAKNQSPRSQGSSGGDASSSSKSWNNDEMASNHSIEMLAVKA